MTARHTRRPKAGETYWVGHGQGPGKIVAVEGGEDWRVLVRYCSGCQPEPPDGNWDSDPEKWELPFNQIWISRVEWGQLQPGFVKRR